jgi:hypothetical protein
MSKILRRPMFRGGPVDSRGTGITSGLMDGGRVGYKTGDIVLGSDLYKPADFSKFMIQNFPEGRKTEGYSPAFLNQVFDKDGELKEDFTYENIFAGNLDKEKPKSMFEDNILEFSDVGIMKGEKSKRIAPNTKKFANLLKTDVLDKLKESGELSYDDMPKGGGVDASQFGKDPKTELETGTETGTGNTTEEPIIDQKALIKENAELFKELFAEANKEKIKRARIEDLSDIGLDIFSKSQQEGATVGSTLAGAADRLVGKKSRVEEAKDAIDKQGDTSIALAINDYISGKRNKEQMDRLIAGKNLDLARAIELADYKDRKNNFIDNLKENVKGMNFSTALITTVQETFGKPPAKIFTKSDIDKGAKVDLVEENVGEYFVYPSGKVTTIQKQSDGSFAEVIVYTRGG